MPGYEILDELGRGGMGVVYKATQKSLNRVVALKTISIAGLNSPEAKSRFWREAEAIARLQHANIVQIFEVGEAEGQPFFSMEFVEGGNLASLIQDVPQSPQEAAKIVALLARAVAAAHEKNIIHRDLKPANVLLTPAGAPKVTDFGLAKQLDSMSHLTVSGAIMGTPSYMAPEQAAGANDQIGPATDVYGLGAILYKMLTGRAPFLGVTRQETIELVLRGEPIPPRYLSPRTPAALEAICLSCLQRSPGKRHLSAAQLAVELEKWQSGATRTAQSETISIPVITSHTRRWVVVMLLLLNLSLAALVWHFGFAAQRPEQPAVDPETELKLLITRLREKGDTVEATAAEIKLSNLQKKRRLAAVIALGDVDCRYYPEAETSLANALRNDPDEDVREAAAKAIARSNSRTKGIIGTLLRTANRSSKDGSPQETSERVREAARLAALECMRPDELLAFLTAGNLDEIKLYSLGVDSLNEKSKEGGKEGAVEEGPLRAGTTDFRGKQVLSWIAIAGAAERDSFVKALIKSMESTALPPSSSLWGIRKYGVRLSRGRTVVDLLVSFEHLHTVVYEGDRGSHVLIDDSLKSLFDQLLSKPSKAGVPKKEKKD